MSYQLGLVLLTNVLVTRREHSIFLPEEFGLFFHEVREIKFNAIVKGFKKKGF